MRGRGGFGAHLEELLLHLVDGLLLLALDDAAIWEHRSAAARPGPAPRPRRRETSTGCGGHRGASALRRRRVSGEAQRPGGAGVQGGGTAGRAARVRATEAMACGVVRRARKDGRGGEGGTD